MDYSELFRDEDMFPDLTGKVEKEKKVYKIKMQCIDCHNIEYTYKCTKCGGQMKKYKNHFK